MTYLHFYVHQGLSGLVWVMLAHKGVRLYQPADTDFVDFSWWCFAAITISTDVSMLFSAGLLWFSRHTEFRHTLFFNLTTTQFCHPLCVIFDPTVVYQAIF